MKNGLVIKFILCLLLCISVNSSVFAGTKNILQKNEKWLSLMDVLELAMQNNPKIREAWLNVEVSDYAHRVELSNYLPTIKGELSYANNKDKEDDEKNDTSRNESLSPSVTLSYLLFDFGGREANVANFRHKLAATQFETNSFVQNFIYQVTEAYYNLFSSLASEKASRESENSSHEAFRAASMRYKLGLVPMTDKLQAEISYIQQKLVREKAENDVEIKRAELYYLLNMSPNSKIKFDIPSMDMPNDDFDDGIVNLIDIAFRNRPDLKSYYETRKAKKAEVWSGASGLLPVISLNASYGTRNDRIDNDKTDYYNVGLNASMPFFTGGYVYNNVSKTKTELKIFDEKIKDLEKNIELDVWTAYQNFITAKKTYKTSEKLLKNTIETEKTMLGRYKNGKSSILDLLNSQTDLATARYEFIDSQHKWFINRANLVRAIGNMSVEELRRLTTPVSSSKRNNN